MLMLRGVQCYGLEISRISVEQGDVYPLHGPDITLGDWWNKNRNRPFWEIQIEAVDSATAYFESAKLEGSHPPHIDGPHFDEQEFDALRKNNLKILNALKATIAATKQPFRPTSIFEEFASMYLLPWRTETHNR